MKYRFSDLGGGGQIFLLEPKLFQALLRTGYELIYSFPQPTPMILVVNIHDSRASDIVVPDHLTAEPHIPITSYSDSFG